MDSRQCLPRFRSTNKGHFMYVCHSTYWRAMSGSTPLRSIWTAVGHLCLGGERLPLFGFTDDRGGVPGAGDVNTTWRKILNDTANPRSTPSGSWGMPGMGCVGVIKFNSDGTITGRIVLIHGRQWRNHACGLKSFAGAYTRCKAPTSQCGHSQNKSTHAPL